MCSILHRVSHFTRDGSVCCGFEQRGWPEKEIGGHDGGYVAASHVYIVTIVYLTLNLRMYCFFMGYHITEKGLGKVLQLILCFSHLISASSDLIGSLEMGKLSSFVVL